MSKARQKGTRGENFFLDKLRTIWPELERAPLKGTQDKGDYVNCPFPVEAKNTIKPLFQAWIRTLRKKADGHRWVLVWKGDARTGDGQPVMVVDLEHGIDLLHAYYGPFGHERRQELAAEIRGDIEYVEPLPTPQSPPNPPLVGPPIAAQVGNDGDELPPHLRSIPQIPSNAYNPAGD